ncbi:MAG TPA: dipeptide/oligopeptide/nickel ABC transporter permease/ATP-binding protein [Mycobacteriales bacterium]|nr:dipeptide/oligopeptide/nickel ABC transporter permease/ATP-binding protein [Mycobacteriales bacterium]
MTVTATLPTRPGRMSGAKRALQPLFAARGMPRVLLWVGLVLTFVFVVFAIFAPLIAPYGFNQYTVHGHRFPQQAAPSLHHLLGTTVQSDDVLSRVIWGARSSVEVVAVSLAVSLVIGVPLGLISGYFGGWLDRVLVLVNDSLIAFPYLLLAIVVAFLLQGSVGGGVLTAAFAITVIYIPQYFRVVRNTVLSVREEPYVEAGRILGARPGTVIRRYVFGNVIQSVPVLASLNAADAILTLAALSFLGIGIDPSAASEWGYDIQRGISDAQAGIWWTGLFPGLAIILTVTGLTLVGESLNDTINPLLRQRRFRRITLPPEVAAGTGGAGGLAAPVLQVRDLRVWYGTERGPVRAVDGVNLDIRRGETLGLVGESGCGKSTLGRGLLGLLPEGAHRAGSVSLDGQDLLDLSPAELRWLRGPSLGMIFQEPMTRLNPLMSIRDHFSETLRAHEVGMPAEEIRRRSLDALGAMGIPPTRFNNYPYEFSGGMRQRILIALSLVLQPKLVVADEPTTALDVLVEAQIISILADIKRNFDTAILFITHNLGIIAEACDRVAVMYAGRIVEQGGVADVFSAPQHPYTQELLASTISLSTTGLHYIPGAPPDLVEPPPGCRFHPRCPHAMRVCRDQFPVPVDVGLDHPVECWLHGPQSLIPDGATEPLPRADIGTADEA